MEAKFCECYVKYLDASNGFRETSKDFVNYDDAMTWMKNNFEKIDPDMVKYHDKPKIIMDSTNSEIGSYHWYHSILARHKHIGEFLKDKTPDEKTLREWGKNLYDTSQELIEGFNFIENN